MLRIFLRVAIMGIAIAICATPGSAADDVGATGDIFRRDNLIAWCIVPFDSQKRGPEERAAMLQRLGFKHFAYDYRAEHVPTFDAEIEACRRHGVSLDAWWFPRSLGDEAQKSSICAENTTFVRNCGLPATTPRRRWTATCSAASSRKRPGFALWPKPRPRRA